MTVDQMVGWHHRLNRHEFEQPPGVGNGQGSLILQSMGSQMLDRTEGLTLSSLRFYAWRIFQVAQNQVIIQVDF